MSKIANIDICFCGRLVVDGKCAPCGVTFESAHKHIYREKKTAASQIPAYVKGGKDNLPTAKEKKNIPKDEITINSLGWLYRSKNKAKVK